MWDVLIKQLKGSSADQCWSNCPRSTWSYKMSIISLQLTSQMLTSCAKSLKSTNLFLSKSEYIVKFNITCCRFDFSKFSAFNKSLIAKVDQMISEVCRICLFGSFNCQLVANKSVQDVPRIMSLIPAEDIKKKSVGGGLIQGGVFEKVLHISLPGVWCVHNSSWTHRHFHRKRKLRCTLLLLQTNSFLSR